MSYYLRTMKQVSLSEPLGFYCFGEFLGVEFLGEHPPQIKNLR